MSSSDERILRSVDDVVEAVGRLLGEIRGAPDIDDEKKDIAVEKAGEVAGFLQEINSLLFTSYDDGETLDDAASGEGVDAGSDEISTETMAVASAPQDSAEKDGAAGDVQPSLIITPVETKKSADIADDKMVADNVPAEEDPVYEVNNLTLIKGIDDDVAAALAGLKVTSFRQIAAFGEDDVQAVSGLVDDPARVARENWIEQAALLMGDVPTQYSALQMDAAVFDRASFNEAYSAIPIGMVAEDEASETDGAEGDLAESALIQSERDLLEAELANLRAQLAAHNVGAAPADGAADNDADIGLDAGDGAEPALAGHDAEVAAEDAVEADEFESGQSEPLAVFVEMEDAHIEEPLAFSAAFIQQEDAAPLPAAQFERADVDAHSGDGAIWHEEVSTAPDYVPPVVDDEDFVDADLDGELGDSASEVSDEDAPLMHGHSDDEHSDDEHSDDGHDDEDLSDLAAAFGFAGAPAPERDDAAVPPPALEGYDSLGITTPKTREKQDEFVNRAFAENKDHTQDEIEVEDGAETAVEAEGDESANSGDVLPFPPSVGEPLPPLPDVDGPPHALQQGASAKMTPAQMGPAPIRPPHMPPTQMPPDPAAQNGGGARALGPKGPAGLRPLPGARLMPGGGVPGNGMRPHARNGGPAFTPSAGPPPVPPMNGVQRGPVDLPLAGQEAAQTVTERGDEGAASGMLPRSPDDLYLAADATADLGAPPSPPAPPSSYTGAPDEQAAQPDEDAEKEQTDKPSGDRLEKASDEAADSQPLGQYLARKRGLDVPVAAERDEDEPAAATDGPPPLHPGAMPPHILPPGARGPGARGAGAPHEMANGMPRLPNGALPPGRPPGMPGQPLPPGQMPPGQKVAQGQPVPQPGQPGPQMGRQMGRPAPGVPNGFGHARLPDGVPINRGAPPSDDGGDRRRRKGPDEPRDEHGVSDGFRMRARKFAESLERSFVEDDE